MSKLLQQGKSGNDAVSEELQSKGPNRIVIKHVTMKIVLIGVIL